MKDMAFFYVNPLEVVPEACEKDDRLRHVKPQRQKWFGCACCPPNLARFLGSLPSYAFSAGSDTLYMHLYIGGEVRVALAHAEVHLSVESDYPWDGRVRLTVHTPGEYGIAVRISGWCRGYELKVNGESVSSEPVRGYVSLNRVWREEDMVELNLKMPVTLMRANPAVRADTGKLCVVRGPLVYSLEEADNGKDLHLLRLPLQTAFEVHDEPQLLGGIRTIRCNAFRRSKSFAEGQLYAPVCGAEEMTETQLTWIPYFAWANREPGEMAVWIREV